MFMVTYGRNDTFEVISYEDADFGVFADDIKSTLHFFFFFYVRAAISRKSVKRPITAFYNLNGL